jgi:Ca-activated chloride channel family protein
MVGNIRRLPFLLVGLTLALGSARSPQAPSAPVSQAAPQTQQATTLRTTTELVHLTATVTDRRHKFITDLDKADFRVLEDGKPQQIERFYRQTDLPLRIAMLLDTSNSIRERLHFEQDAAINFLDDVIRRNKDMAFLMTFDNEPQVIQDYTGDLDSLTTAIQKQRAGGGTALRDAIYVAAQKLANPPLPSGPNPEVRRVLVLISDGEDNLSDHTLSEAIEMADHTEVSIYSISTNTDWLALGGKTPQKLHRSHGEDVLQQFAEVTGGRVFFPYKIDDLAESFQDIGNELRSQYLMTYRPANSVANGKYRTIRVEVDRKGLLVRSRKGYFAVVASSDAGKPLAPSPNR